MFHSCHPIAAWFAIIATGVDEVCGRSEDRDDDTSKHKKINVTIWWWNKMYDCFWETNKVTAQHTFPTLLITVPNPTAYQHKHQSTYRMWKAVYKTHNERKTNPAWNRCLLMKGTIRKNNHSHFMLTKLGSHEQTDSFLFCATVT